MATLASVIETLRDINKTQEESSERRSEELKSTVSQSIKELSQAIEKSRGFRLPSLPSITNIITNNPISNAIRSIKDTITSAVTAPYRLLAGAISTIGKTFTGIFAKVGSLVMSPFNMLKNLIFPAGGSDKESIKILKEINLGVKELNNNFQSYIDMLKNQSLDELEARRESARDRTESPDSPDPRRRPDTTETVENNRFSFLALPGFKLLAGLTAGVAIEALGLDDFVKALMLPDLFKGIRNVFGRITRFFKSVIGLFSKIKLPDIPNVFKSITDLFSRIKLPDLPSLKLPSLPGFNLGLPDFSKYLDPLKSFFTSVGKFFSGAFDIFKPLLAPIKAASKMLKAVPIVGWVLTAFDGLFGAIRGFTETDGSLTDKLWGAFEGAILGIVTGVTDAIDLLAIKIPAWFLEKLGFEGAAEKLRGFSLTTLVENLWASIKGLFDNGIDGLTTTLKNIPDYLYLAAQRHLRISMPEISVGLPEWLGGGKFTLIPAFSIGFGSNEGAAEAQQNIDRRNSELIQRRRTIEEESSRVLERSQERLNVAEDRVNGARMAAIQNNVDARQTQNNVSVMNQGAFPLPVDTRDPVRGPI